MPKPIHNPSSSQPDPHLLAILGRLQSVFLIAVALFSAIVLAGWLLPPLGRVLPHGWDLMKVNTTLLVLGSCASLFLWQPRRSPRALLAARLLAIAVTLLAAATLLEYAGHISLHIDTLFAADPLSPMPGRLSLQTAWSFLLIGVILTHLRARKRTLALFLDLLTFALFLLLLTFLSGYFFGALHLYGLSLKTRIAPQTLISLSLLTFVIINRRAEYGILSILLGSGMGGKTARVAAPCAIALPFLLSALQSLCQLYTAIPYAYTQAISASILALCGFCVVLLLARRSSALEHATRELSLRDELTTLYNRRGFYFLAEQALLLSRRAGVPFFVLFIDMDHLKLINDTLGHDAGSDRLRQLGLLLTQTFRETDVVGRLGGDEFVVAGTCESGEPTAAISRLEKAVAALLADTFEPYPLSFSLGNVTSARGSRETLEQLIDRADAVMYEAKRAKKQLHSHDRLLQPSHFANA